MDRQEAIKILQTYQDVKFGNDGTLISESINKGIEALEQADQYRWHNLRKCPDDLPDSKDKDILCYLYDMENDKYFYASSRFYGYGEVCQGFKEFPNGVWEAHGYGFDVIKWKYIEPFESEE